MRKAVLAAAAACLAGCGSPTSPPPPGARATFVHIQAGFTGSSGYPGQSFRLEPGQRIQQLRFNWHRRTGDPSAAGTLYLLTQEFLGRPGDLSPSTYGYLSHSMRIEDNRYVFPDLITISSGATYWIYSNAQQDYSLNPQADVYAGGEMYHSTHGTQLFRRTADRDVSFSLEGVAIPRN